MENKQQPKPGNADGLETERGEHPAPHYQDRDPDEANGGLPQRSPRTPDHLRPEQKPGETPDLGKAWTPVTETK